MRRRLLRLLNQARAEYDRSTGILYLTPPTPDPDLDGRILVLRPSQQDEANRILNGEDESDDDDDEEHPDDAADEDDDDGDEEASAVKERRVRREREARLREAIKRWRLSPCGGGCLLCGCSRVTLVEREAQVRRRRERERETGRGCGEPCWKYF